MRKKAIWGSMIVALIIVCVALSACMPKFSGGDAKITDDYKSSEVNAKIDAMRTNGGLRLVFKGIADADEGTDDVTYVYAANGDLYYFSVDAEETYFDLSADDHVVEYHKNANEDWTKVVTYYDDSFTKEDEKQNIRNSAEAVFNWMLFYDDEENTDSSGMAKETGEAIGRSCDKYSWGMSFLGVKVSYACWIDKETGICLRWNTTTSAFGQGVDVNFECQSFETNYTFGTMPEVSEEKTTYNNQPEQADGTVEE